MSPLPPPQKKKTIVVVQKGGLVGCLAQEQMNYKLASICEWGAWFFLISTCVVCSAKVKFKLCFWSGFIVVVFLSIFECSNLGGHLIKTACQAGHQRYWYFVKVDLYVYYIRIADLYILCTPSICGHFLVHINPIYIISKWFVWNELTESHKLL